MAFKNGLATCRNYIIVWSFLQVQIHPRKELLRGFWCSFISQSCFIWHLWAPVLCVPLFHTVQTEIASPPPRVQKHASDFNGFIQFIHKLVYSNWNVSLFHKILKCCISYRLLEAVSYQKQLWLTRVTSFYIIVNP